MLKVICIVFICASVLVRAQDYGWADHEEDYSEEYIDSPEFGAKHGLVINSLCRWKCDAAHSKNIRTAKHDRLCLYVCRGPAVTTTTPIPTVLATTIPEEETAISYEHPLSHHDHHIISLICKPYCKPTTNNALRTYGYCAPFCHGNTAIGKPDQQTEPTTTLAPTTPKPVPASQGIGHGIGHGISHGISHGIGHGIGQGFSNYYHIRKFCRNHCTGQSYHYHRHPACPILCHSKPSSSPTLPVSSASPTPSVSILTTSPPSVVSGFPTLPPSASGSGSSSSGSSVSGPSASGPSASGPSGPSGPGSPVSKPPGTGTSTSGPMNTATTVEKPEDLVEAARLLKAFCTKFCPIETTFRRARSTMQERMCESLCDRSIPDSTTEKPSNKPPPMENSEKPAA